MSNQGCYEDPIDLTASEVDSQPPAAKPLPSVWLPDDDPKPRVNTSYKKVPKEFIEYQRKKSPS